MSWPVPVLMYHRMGRAPKGTIVAGQYVPDALFKNHLKLIRWMGFETVHAAEAMAAAQGIMLTFDDAYQTVFDRALPLLTALNWRATTYVVTDQIGGTNDWDVKIGDVVEPLMSRDQLLTWMAHGHKVECHSASHAHLTQLDDEQLHREIFGCRDELEAAMGSPVDSFCYPYGNEDLRVRQAVEQAGFRFGFATTKGAWTSQTDPYRIPRINCRRDTWTPILFLKLRRALSNR